MSTKRGNWALISHPRTSRRRYLYVKTYASFLIVTPISKGIYYLYFPEFFAIRCGILEAFLADDEQEQWEATDRGLNKTSKTQETQCSDTHNPFDRKVSRGPNDSRLYVDEDSIPPSPS